MKTNCYQLELMIPNQANKDIIYNQSIVTLDSFLNFAINGFREEKPKELGGHDKYIITKGPDINKIYYLPLPSQPAELLMPVEGMIFYLLEEKSFFIFKQSNWRPILSPLNINSNVAKTEFISIEGKYHLSDSDPIFYLYLNGDVEIEFDLIQQQHFTIILKQHYQNSYKLKWPTNILWQAKQNYVMTATPNSMDIISFYKLPEINHFLAASIHQNYQF